MFWRLFRGREEGAARPAPPPAVRKPPSLPPSAPPKKAAAPEPKAVDPAETARLELRSALAPFAGVGPNPQMSVLLQLSECWEKEGNVPRKALLEGLAKAAPRAGREFLGHALVAGRTLAEDALLYSLSKTLRIPRYNLARYDINPAAISAVQGAMARRHEVFPIDLLGRILTLAVANPFLKTEDLGVPKGLLVRKVLCPREEIRSHFDIYYPIDPPPAQPAAPAPRIAAAAAAATGPEGIFAQWSRLLSTPPVPLLRIPDEELDFHGAGPAR